MVLDTSLAVKRLEGVPYTTLNYNLVAMTKENVVLGASLVVLELVGCPAWSQMVDTVLLRQDRLT